MTISEMTKKNNLNLTFTGETIFTELPWNGNISSYNTEVHDLRQTLLCIDEPVWAVEDNNIVALTNENGWPSGNETSSSLARRIAYAAPMPIENFGDPAFMQTYGTRYAYYGGAMANGIASVDMVIALGQAGFMGSFGSAGLPIQQIEQAIHQIQTALPEGPYAFNLIHSPNEPTLERRLVELYLQHGVQVIEASAYMDLTYALVHFRVAGLQQNNEGEIQVNNRIIAKVSRKEVARRFMEPAPQDLLDQLLQDGKIAADQAAMAKATPMADDVTVEADSGGHTDNRPLVGLIPSMLALRDEIQQKHNYFQPVRVGAGGGISTPASALAAFAMGAAYIVTGSVNQACIESGASAYTRKLLAEADMADIIMAPAADMFEMGVKVQVLKRGTMFAMRAAKLYELYSRYESIEAIPLAEREKVEKTIFRRKLDDIWADTVSFFESRDPQQLQQALNNPHHKMALIFRWYLGLSSRWSARGESGREMDYQIWCGPSMGAFNEWVQGSYLADMDNRRVADVARQILLGAAYLSRLRSLNQQGVGTPAELDMYYPQG